MMGPVLGRVLRALGGSLGFYEPTYIPQFATRLQPPPGRALVVVKGWFAHGRFGFQRAPWEVVTVLAGKRLLGVMTEGHGRRSRVIAPVSPGVLDLRIEGQAFRGGSSTLLREESTHLAVGEVLYIAFVPPRPNPFVRRAKPSARWFSTRWRRDEIS